MRIHSDSIIMQKTTGQELDFVLAAEQAEQNRAFIGQWSREQHEAALTNEDILHLAVWDNAGKPVGYAIVTGLQNPNLAVCLQRIVIAAKGQGYGKKTVQLLADWVFANTPAHRLWLDVREHNSRARHVYESVGFKFEGTLRECVKVGDNFESLHIMSILRHEYSKAVL